MGTPNDMKKYLQNGAASAGVLWDAKALGCLTAWAGLQLAQNKQFQASQQVPECGLDSVTYDSSTKILLMGKPLTFTKDNVGDYNF
jgi:rhamnose transport system substrate-binding protein